MFFVPADRQTMSTDGHDQPLSLAPMQGVINPQCKLLLAYEKSAQQVMESAREI